MVIGVDMKENKAEHWSLKSQFSDVFKMIKVSGKRSYFLHFLSLFLPAIIFFVVSFFKPIIFIGALSLVFFSVFAYQNNIETYASVHFNKRLKYKVIMCLRNYFGDLKWIGLIFKIVIFTLLYSIALFGLVLCIAWLVDNNIVDNLSNYLKDSSLNNILYEEVKPLLFTCKIILALCFIRVFTYYSYKEQSLQDFMLTYVNSDKNYFFFIPVPTRVNIIYKNIFRKTSIDLFFVKAISVIVFACGFVLGVFIGTYISPVIETFSPTTFGLGMGLFLYSFLGGITNNIYLLFFSKQQDLLSFIPEILKERFVSFCAMEHKMVRSFSGEENLDISQDPFLMQFSFMLSKDFFENRLFFVEKNELVGDTSVNLGLFDMEDDNEKTI